MSRPRPRPVIACTPEEDRTRQEFKDEVNVNNIIRNVTGLPVRPISFGEVDFDALDRHQVENQLLEANALYASLSREQRRAIPSLAHLIQMATDGYQPPPEAQRRRAADKPPAPKRRKADKEPAKPAEVSSKEDKAGEKPA